MVELDLIGLDLGLELGSGFGLGLVLVRSVHNSGECGKLPPISSDVSSIKISFKNIHWWRR